MIAVTDKRYATYVNNTTHTVTVVPGTTGAELAGDIKPYDQTTQTYDVNSASPSSTALTNSSILNVTATDPAEQNYSVIVAS